MSRFLVFVSIWCLALGLPAFAEPLQEADWYTELVEAPANVICVDSGVTYVLQENELWIVNEAFEKQSLSRKFDENILALDVDQGIIYYAYSTGKEMRFASARGNVPEQLLFEVDSTCRLLELDAAQGYFLTRWRLSQEEALHMNADLKKIVIYDHSGNELAYNYGYDAVFTTENEALILCDDGNPYVWDYHADSLDWLAGQLLGDIITMGGKNVYVVDAVNPVVFEYNTDTHEHRELKIWDDCDYHFSDLICTNDSLIGYQIRGDIKIVSWSITDEETKDGKRTLTFVNCDGLYGPAFEKTIEMFAEKYPEIDIRWETLNDEVLKTMLLTNQGNIDLFYLENSEIYNVVTSGAVIDLNTNEVLSQALGNWVGTDGMCVNGIRFGVPVFLNADFLLKNESLSQYVHFDESADIEWNEFFQRAVDLQTDINGDNVQDIWLLWDSVVAPMWRWQYMNSFATPQEICFDTSIFRELAEQYRECVNRNLILDADRNFEQQDLAIYKAGFYTPTLEGKNYLPLPRIGSKSTVTGYVHSIAIARNSKNQDLAMEFLNMYVSDESQSSEYWIGLNSDSGLYQEYALMSEKEKYLLEERKEYLNQMKPQWMNKDFNLYANEQMAEYLSGEIAVDELVNRLQQKLQMVLWG